MKDLKITVNVSSDNEGTRAPWWVIVDPRQNMRCDIFEAAGQITGPFFSRESAQRFLDTTRYNFTDRARVFCMSGCYSREYDEAIFLAKCEDETA